MESSLKKAYDKEILPDDSVKLVFREGRIAAHQVALFISLFMGYMFMLLWAWLLLAAGLALALGEFGAAGVISLVVLRRDLRRRGRLFCWDAVPAFLPWRGWTRVRVAVAGIASQRSNRPGCRKSRRRNINTVRTE